jgi:hypothetical protein
MPTSTTASGGSSVFDRLYSNSTASSKIRKCVAPVTQKNFLSCHDDGSKKTANRSGKKAATRPVKNTTTVSGGTAIHDRLYSRGTASYNGKRKGHTAGEEPLREQQHHTNARGPLKTKTNS